jgi:hypothetical protein
MPSCKLSFELNYKLLEELVGVTKENYISIFGREKIWEMQQRRLESEK